MRQYSTFSIGNNERKDLTRHSRSARVMTESIMLIATITTFPPPTHLTRAQSAAAGWIRM